MTKGEARKLFLRWLDEATVNGQEASSDLTADLVNRFDYFLDGTLNYVAGIFKLPGKMPIIRFLDRPLDGTGFQTKLLYAGEKWSMQSTSAGSYIFQIVGSGTLKVTSGETSSNTEIPLAGDWVELKDIFSNPNSPGKVEITASSPSIIQNAAIFKTAYADKESIPTYAPTVPYKLPEDYREFDRVYRTDRPDGWEIFTNYQKTNDNILLIPYETEGSYQVCYWRNPTLLGPDADDETELDVIQRAAPLVPLKAAVDIMAGTDDTIYISNYLDGILTNMIMNLLGQETVGDRPQIQTIYRQ